MPGVIVGERALYEDVWRGVPAYGETSPGALRVPMFLEMTGATGSRVLDAGCGSGKGGVALDAAGFRVTLCDFTRAGLSAEASALPFRESCLWHARPDLLGRYDYVYCCDVLEHIPTEYVALTIQRLLDVSLEGLFLSIALVPDQFGLFVGRALHQTVRPYDWWRDRLRDLGRLVDARDLLVSAVFYVRAR